ncbi:DinB family protein [Chryseobacterium sp. SNU WT5]|uniref:DinB family protein n=1 Tax=Chryseobacterium sp. SNU WT5 TaxID=2594269 RepID=UPI00117D7952|nr:DinB family protein [Chryseobacterium sp. SNU WT5]QDP85940.1 DinB family protein [Chryseobacterium sp. SNU WT5]
MNYHFQAHRAVRQNLLEVLQNTSKRDLLLIPDGFNNNIYWNIAHTVATQQLLHYYLSGNPFRIDKYWIETYKKGTLPVLDVPQSEMEDLAFLLTETSKILMKDFDADFFTDYTSYTTSFGLDLKNIQDAIIFNNMHETQHLGYAMAQKRAILGEQF